MSKKGRLTIKVLFDTSAIYTGSASDLFRSEIIELIGTHSGLTDIVVQWCIPETVLNERKFQMNKRGGELLPQIQKLEKLLGHNLNITPEIVQSRIEETIQRQLKANNVEVIKLDLTNVPWNEIIDGAINRKAPFEDNDKEKGFRDALIYQALRQLIASSPRTRSICRIVMVTNDNLLRQVCDAYCAEADNLHVFTKVDELASLLNVLGSEIKEESINAVVGHAEALFFVQDEAGVPVKTTLFYTENLMDRIKADYKKELNELHQGEVRENGTWYIGRPGFEKKIKQRIFWKSIIEVEFSTYKMTYTSGSQTGGFGSPATGSSGLFGSSTLPKSKSIFDNQNWMLPNKEKVSQGRTRFEVLWSVTLKTSQKLVSPKIESIKFLDTSIN